MNITEITKKVGPKPQRKRVGRGEGSGLGKTSGRGHKGAGQRAGYKAISLSEGANFPLFRRLPKYGFSNKVFRTEYQVINVGDLAARFEAGSHVTPAELESRGLIRDKDDLVKVLGDGEIGVKLTVDVHRFSASAEKKITEAGGKVNWLAPKPKKKFVKKPKWQLEAEAKASGKAPEGKGGKKKAKAESDEDAEADAKPKAKGKGKPAAEAEGSAEE